MRFVRPSWFLRLAGGLMTGNISFAGAQTVDGVDISALATLVANVGKIKIGQYTGDAAATKTISGVGFQPDCVIVLRLTAGNASTIIWVLGMDSDKSIHVSAVSYPDDHIKSVNADGFVVGDGTGDTNRLNVAATSYCFVCLKATV
jgi:hypothetical protein